MMIADPNGLAPSAGGPAGGSAAPRRMLVAYSMASTFTTTTLEYLEALKRYSGLEVEYLHVTHDAEIDFDINRYDIVFHSYCARLCFDNYVSASYEAAMQRFLGLKMIAAQDEYDLTATLHRAIRRLGFHVYFTCVPKAFWPMVHPESELPGVHLVQVLTGYVSESHDWQKCLSKPLASRSRKIAYRGRDIGARYGQLGFDKFEIGRRMAEVCTAKGIPHDIATDEASRIYGAQWFELVGDSRIMLGSESGSNAFDFDGTLRKVVAEREKALGRRVGYEEMAGTVWLFEAPFDIGQISPRVFECAAMRTPMIMYRGGYSGAIEPDVHYIALERDFSNIDAILARIDDLDWLQGFADRAHARLVASGEYSYQSFVALVESTAREQYARRIDPAHVSHRRRLQRPWQTPAMPARPASLADANRIALRERPSHAPLGQAEFLQRQDELNKLRAIVQADEQARELLASGKSLLKALRRFILSLLLLAGRIAHRVLLPIWSMLPRNFRRSIGDPLRMLRNALSTEVRHG
jgi:hypothetical protein